MKFLHLSDLHLGKTVHGFSMLEDQEYILKSVLGIADTETPDAALLCGDIFDRTVAPTDALRLLDDFLNGLVHRGIEVFIISGNHDSAERLAFGSRLMRLGGVHISPAYNGSIEPFAFTDAFGELRVYMLPFLRPVQIRRFHPDEEIVTWTDAVRAVIHRMDIDASRRNLLLAHQFVTGAATCESEEVNIGGAENVDAEVFAPFDYVALGHLHGPQSISRQTVRYCGTPLKYSFSETAHQKSVTVAELGEKGSVTVRTVPLTPRRELREIRGTYLELTARDFYHKLNRDDYYRVTLTDEEDQPDAVGKLRILYPNLMRLDYDNRRTRAGASVSDVVEAHQYSPLQLFELFFEQQNDYGISDVQRNFLSALIEQVWEDTR